MDYDRTVTLYEQAGQIKKWKDTPEYFSHESEKRWKEKVTSKRTGSYYQASDLLNRELVPPDWSPPHVDKKGRPLEYPVKYVNSIIRIRTADGEYIKSRQQWWGLDEAGNPINQSMDDKEVYNDILPIYRIRPENPKERDSKMIREVTHIEERIKYTEVYKPETIQRLYDMRNGNCTLVLKDESKGDKHSYSVESFEDFRDKPFEEVWHLATTPKAGRN